MDTTCLHESVGFSGACRSEVKNSEPPPDGMPLMTTFAADMVATLGSIKIWGWALIAHGYVEKKFWMTTMADGPPNPGTFFSCTFKFWFRDILGVIPPSFWDILMWPGSPIEMRINGRGARSARSMGFREAEVTFPPTYKYVPGRVDDTQGDFTPGWIGLSCQCKLVLK